MSSEAAGFDTEMQSEQPVIQENQDQAQETSSVHQHRQAGIHLQHNNEESGAVDTPQAPLLPPLPPTQQSNKGLTTVFVTRLGQESVQEIYGQAFEIFRYLKDLPLPNGCFWIIANQSNMRNKWMKRYVICVYSETPLALLKKGSAQVGRNAREKKLQLQDKLRIIKLKFRQLRRIFEKCNENCQIQGMEYIDTESLVPLMEDCDLRSDEKKTSEAYRLASEEKQRVIEQVVLKNRQLKDIIYHLRRLVSEISAMLHMRLT